MVWDAELWARGGPVAVVDAYWPQLGVAVEAVEQEATARHTDALRALSLSVLRIEPRCRFAMQTLRATLAEGARGAAEVRGALRTVPC